MKKAIVHIKVGAEKYWEEVEGRVRVACDLQDIEVGASTTTSYSLSANQRTLSAGEAKSFSNGKGVENTIYIPIQSLETLQRNDNHSFSILANKLGATIYGGFEDEKDFYLVLPTVEGFKVGDVSIFDFYGKFKYRMLCFGEFEFCEDFHNTPSSSTYGFYWKEDDDYDKLYSWYSDQSVSKNIFQEYARTGIIENDLYKQFFK